MSNEVKTASKVGGEGGDVSVVDEDRGEKQQKITLEGHEIDERIPEIDRWLPHWNLYVQSLFFSFSDRLFDFAVLSSIASIFSFTFIVSATYGLMTGALTFFFTPPILEQVAKFSSFKFQIGLTILHKTTMIVSLFSIYFITTLLQGKELKSIEDLPFSDFSFDFSVLFMIFFSTVSQITSVGSAFLVTSSWVKVVGTTNPFQGPPPPPPEEITLVLQRIGLICMFIAPFIFGIIAAISSVQFAVIVCSSSFVFFGIGEVFFQKILCSHYPQLEDEKPNRLPNTSSLPSTSTDSLASTSPSSQTESLWSTFYKQPTFLPSLGYILQKMSSLIPGVVPITFAMWKGLSFVQISVFYAVGTVIGHFSYLITPALSDKIGLERTALLFSWLQCSILIVGSVFPLFLFPHLSVWFLLVAILLAQIEVCGLDIVQKEITRDQILAEQVINTVTIVNNRLKILMVMLNYFWAFMSVNSENFRWLAVVSVLSCFCGSCIYTFWYHFRLSSNSSSSI